VSLNRTSLTPYARQMQDPDPKGSHKLAARMWHTEGAVVLRAESIARLDPLDRDYVRAIAAKLYGPRED